MAPVLEPRDINISKLSINTSEDASSHEVPKSESSRLAFNGPLSRLSAYQLPNLIVRDYLRKQEPVFRALDDLREQVKHYLPSTSCALSSDCSTGLEQCRR